MEDRESRENNIRLDTTLETKVDTKKPTEPYLTENQRIARDFWYTSFELSINYRGSD